MRYAGRAFLFKSLGQPFPAGSLPNRIFGLTPMHKTIKDRFHTFFFILDELAADVSDEVREEADERLGELWKAAESLIEERQATLPRRTYLDEPYQVECTRWEWCDQVAYVEAREGMLAWPIQFYLNREPEQQDLDALRQLCIDAFTEVCGAAGIPVRYLHAEQSITYEVTERITVA